MALWLLTQAGVLEKSVVALIIHAKGVITYNGQLRAATGGRQGRALGTLLCVEVKGIRDREGVAAHPRGPL